MPEEHCEDFFDESGTNGYSVLIHLDAITIKEMEKIVHIHMGGSEVTDDTLGGFLKYIDKHRLCHQKSCSAFKPAAVKPQSGTTGNDVIAGNGNSVYHSHVVQKVPATADRRLRVPASILQDSRFPY